MPNNQEVFMHDESDQSIIVEILERVDEVSEENAIKWGYQLNERNKSLLSQFRYHFDALAEANDAQNVQDHIVDRIEAIPIDSLNVQR